MRTLAVLLVAAAAYADTVDDLLAKAASDSWAERWAAVQGFARMPVGDHYFKVDHDHHNLDRARVQFAMVRFMEANEAAMRLP